MTKTEEVIADTLRVRVVDRDLARRREKKLARMLQVGVAAHRFIVGRDARSGPPDVISAEALAEIERVAGE